MSRVDAELIGALAAQGLSVSPFQLERWRAAGQMPRNRRRGLGRGMGSVSELDDQAVRRAAFLAPSTGQGSALMGSHVRERFMAGRAVPEAKVRAAYRVRLGIGDTLVQRGVRLSLGGSIYDPADPMSKMFFNMLAVFAEFEADLLKMRTREGMAVARAKGKLKGKKPKLTARQQSELIRMRGSGEYSIVDLMEMFSVGRATVYRVLDRAAHGPTGGAA